MRDFRAYALRLISIRPRSEYELRKRLKEKGANIDEIEDIINSFKNAGLLDDADFACEFARSKALQHWSWFRIARELKFKFRISGEIVDKARDCYDETEVIKYYINKFSAHRKDVEYIKRHLYSKGFSHKFVNRVLEGLEIC